MADQLPAAPPCELTAGDTAQWQREFRDYLPGHGWQLTYVLVGLAAVFNIGADQVSASDDGLGYVVTVPAAVSATWGPGRYNLLELVTNADTAERFTLAATWVRILPNLAAATEGSDNRSHAQKVLDALNAWLESKAPVAGALEINGRKISYYPLNELLAMRDRYARMVANENGCGGGPGRRVLAVL